MTAPMVLDGAMHGAAFLAYVEHSAGAYPRAERHRGDGQPRCPPQCGAVREAIRRAGAELRFLPPYSPDLNPIEILLQVQGRPQAPRRPHRHRVTEFVVAHSRHIAAGSRRIPGGAVVRPCSEIDRQHAIRRVAAPAAANATLDIAQRACGLRCQLDEWLSNSNQISHRRAPKPARRTVFPARTLAWARITRLFQPLPWRRGAAHSHGNRPPC